MKKVIVFFLLLVALSAYAQERRTQISVNSGLFRAGNQSEYKNIQTWYNFGIDVSHFLTERFFLTAHWNFGKNHYYEGYSRTNISNDHPRYSFRFPGPTNSIVKMNNVGLLAGYFHPVSEWMNWRAQIGISQFIETRRFPFRKYPPYSGSGFNDITRVDATIFSMAFPVKFDVGLTPFKRMRNVELGLTFGFYMMPEWGFFTGTYLAPQLAVWF